MDDVRVFIPKNSRGLSFEIDKRLDAEFSQKYGIENVSLDGNQWQSIFNIIQSNQAEQVKGQNTFNESDNDVCNSSHYVVHAGQDYIIKGEVWEIISNKVKEFLKIEQPAQDDAKTIEQPVPEQPVTPEPVRLMSQGRAAKYTEVSGYLKEFLDETGLEFKGQLAVDVINKYDTMVKFAAQNNITLNEDEIKTRLYNYAKGWQFHNFEVKSLAAKNPEDFKSGTETSTTETELKEKYEVFAKQYIEYYDKDFSNDIDIYEMMYVDFKDHYKYFQKLYGKDNLNNKEATIKTVEIIKQYMNGELIPNPNGNDDEQLLAGILSKITYYDIGEDENGEMTTNNKLSVDEVKAALIHLATKQPEKGAKKHIISSKEVVMQHYDFSTLDHESQLALFEAYDYVNNK